MLEGAYIYDGVRTPVGRYGGALATTRPDDLAALTIAQLVSRYQFVDWGALDDVVLGCANQAGEDNRNVARMAALLAGLPIEVGGITVNRLCASGLDAVGIAYRAIESRDAEFMLAGGVESMTRAPFVLAKSETPYARQSLFFDTTIGWRFVNGKMQKAFGTDSMPETADNVAKDFNISRADQDAFAYRSQQRWARAYENNFFADEIMSVEIPKKRGETVVFTKDEHPRPETTLEKLSTLRAINGEGLTVTAGNASGVNDGAALLLVAGESFGKKIWPHP